LDYVAKPPLRGVRDVVLLRSRLTDKHPHMSVLLYQWCCFMVTSCLPFSFPLDTSLLDFHDTLQHAAHSSLCSGRPGYNTALPLLPKTFACKRGTLSPLAEASARNWCVARVVLALVLSLSASPLLPFVNCRNLSPLCQDNLTKALDIYVKIV
jgi:hypothetical protein